MKKLSEIETKNLLKTLKKRFEGNLNRHPNLDWDLVEKKLINQPDKLWSLSEMENSDGEPDVVDFDSKTNQFTFFDCAEESPKARRSLCYDHQALESRKEFKPKNSVQRMAAEMGIELINEQEYRFLQTLGNFDNKTSSWLETPEYIRKLGGAIFGDFRFNTTFVYHNGAESYYAGRGFRGKIIV